MLIYDFPCFDKHWQTMKSLLLLLTSAYLASCLPPPHPAVVAVRREEELLPPHLRSPALHNPRLREILPLTSLLHHGEMVVCCEIFS